MGFEFQELLSPPVAAEFKPNENIPDGKGLQLLLNMDVVTMDFLEFTMQSVNTYKEVQPLASAAKKNKSVLDQEAEITKGLGYINTVTEQMKSQARMLGGKPSADDPAERIIQSWDLVRNGKPVPVNYESMISLGFKILNDLFNFCVYKVGQPTKKKEKRSGSTS